MIKHFIFFLLFIIIAFYINYYFTLKHKEGFYSYFLDESGSIYPKSVNKNGILVNNQYPFIDRKKLTSKNNYSSYWWKFQNIKNSNYEQITNNFKHIRNPDVANSIPQEFTGIFYHNIKNKSNVICPLPPVPDQKGSVRVGYFNTPVSVTPM